jgi:ATP-dependent helicase/nuclease subunit A
VPRDDEVLRDPAEVDGRSLGTLVHAVLAAIDYSQPGDWRRLVPVHADRQLLAANSPEAREAVQLIERFLASPRAAALAQATVSHVEAEFLLAWSPQTTASGQLLLSGYIDRLDADGAGRWHVLDFKTNRVRPDTLPRVAADYEMQMLVYALAAERILGQAPAELTVHFLRGGLEYRFAWDDAAHERARALVDEALAALGVAGSG